MVAAVMLDQVCILQLQTEITDIYHGVSQGRVSKNLMSLHFAAT